MCDNGV